MSKAYIGLGSNIEPRKQNLDEALRVLDSCDGVQVTHLSPIYETDPVGYFHQADFLNMVVELETKLKPLELLDVCLYVENKLGRKRIIDKGPRTIDLDILLYDDLHVQLKQLEIPHPRLHERAFVLVPLNKLAANYEHPFLKQSVQFLLNNLPASDVAGVKRWDET